jgi:hypothetical protein
MDDMPKRLTPVPGVTECGFGTAPLVTCKCMHTVDDDTATTTDMTLSKLITNPKPRPSNLIPKLGKPGAELS